MNDAWRRLSIVWKLALGAGFLALSFLAVLSMIQGFWMAAATAIGTNLILAWSFGPLEASRIRTTERLSRAQTEALWVLALVVFWAARFIVAGETSIYLAVAIGLFAIWTAWTAKKRGWSRRPD